MREDRALNTDAGEAEEVVVSDEGKVPSGHAPKKSKHHHKPPTSEDQQKQVNSRNPSILGALIGESPQSSQAESTDKEEGDGNGSDGQVKPSKGRKSRKRRKKHYDVHIAMSKQSIPAKGTRLVSPWKDLRGHCCRDLQGDGEAHQRSSRHQLAERHALRHLRHCGQRRALAHAGVWQGD